MSQYSYSYTYVPYNASLLCRQAVLNEGFTTQTLHVHHSDELGIYDGSVTCRIVNNGQEYTVKAPAIVWNRAGSFHELTEVKDGSLHYYGIDYNRKLLSNLPSDIVYTRFLGNYDLVVIPLTQEQLEELKTLIQAILPRNLPQFEKLMTLLSLFHKLDRWSRDCPNMIRSNQTPHYVFQLAYQLQDLSKPMGNIEDLAQQFFVGKTKLKADFKKVFGIPVLAYRRRIQLQTAKALLESSSMEIGKIAVECGFQDESYFIQVFRKSYGLTPGAYRNNKQKS